MVDSSRVIVFRITGRASEPSTMDFERAIDLELQAAGKSDNGDTHLYAGRSESIKKLQRMSPILSKEIERQILMMLPPDPEMVVDADVQFRAGSVVLIATVAILNWAGSVALEKSQGAAFRDRRSRGSARREQDARAGRAEPLSYGMLRRRTGGASRADDDAPPGHDRAVDTPGRQRMVQPACRRALPDRAPPLSRPGVQHRFRARIAVVGPDRGQHARRFTVSRRPRA